MSKLHDLDALKRPKREITEQSSGVYERMTESFFHSYHIHDAFCVMISADIMIPRGYFYSRIISQSLYFYKGDAV